jgi:hypothetical protein
MLAQAVSVVTAMATVSFFSTEIGMALIILY